MSENEGDRDVDGTDDPEESAYETSVAPSGSTADLEDHAGVPDDVEPSGEVSDALAAVAEDDPVLWGLASATPTVVSRVRRVKTVAAGVWPRAAAALLDAAVSLAAAGVVVLVSELLWLRSDGAVSVPVWVPVVVFFAVGWAHTLFGEGLCAGVTLGKRALRLRVVGGGGADPVLWRVAARRVCLDVVVMAVAALALWLTMVRQYGGLPAGAPVDLDASDAVVFCAFFANLVVLLALGRRLDPQRRFPHDSLAGLAVLRTVALAAGEGAGAGAGVGRRRVAAPVGAVSARWTEETAEVAPVRPWDGREWRPDPAAAGRVVARERARMGPASRLIERVVAWGQGSAASPVKDADVGSEEGSRPSGRGRRSGVVNRLADRVVAWSEGEPGPASGGRERDSVD